MGAPDDSVNFVQHPLPYVGAHVRVGNTGEVDQIADRQNIRFKKQPDDACVVDRNTFKISERNRLISALPTLASVRRVYPSDANFILVEFENPRDIYSRLLSERIVVRDRTNAVANCLRISVGTREENDRLLNVLNSIA